jgi:hypothetical protein
VPTHAAALRPHGDWMTGLIDPTAHGRDQMDGFRLKEILMNHSVRLEAILDPVEAGILEIQSRMSYGRLKVFASMKNSAYIENSSWFRGVAP